MDTLDQILHEIRGDQITDLLDRLVMQPQPSAERRELLSGNMLAIQSLTTQFDTYAILYFRGHALLPEDFTP